MKQLQNINFSQNCPKFHKNCNFKIIGYFLDQLLLPYKFYGGDMLGMFFFIFASCEPLMGHN